MSFETYWQIFNSFLDIYHLFFFLTFQLFSEYILYFRLSLCKVTCFIYILVAVEYALMDFAFCLKHYCWPDYYICFILKLYELHIQCQRI